MCGWDEKSQSEIEILKANRADVPNDAESAQIRKDIFLKEKRWNVIRLNNTMPLIRFNFYELWASSHFRRMRVNGNYDKLCEPFSDQFEGFYLLSFPAGLVLI